MIPSQIDNAILVFNIFSKKTDLQHCQQHKPIFSWLIHYIDYDLKRKYNERKINARASNIS